MNELVFIISVIAFLLILFMFYENRYSELTQVTSKIDKKQYLVRNREDKQEAADLLAKIVSNIDKIINHGLENGILKNLIKKYNRDNISESLSSSKYTSYSVNKGEKLVFCIRHKDINQNLIDLNTLMFVVIHELAHLESKSVGHNKEFWDNMRLILKIGIELGVYNNVDYKQNPTKYCGINITATPLNGD